MACLAAAWFLQGVEPAFEWGDLMGWLNVSDTEQYNGEIIFSVDQVLADATNHTTPITLALTEPGINQRLVFELFRLQENIFKYDGIWTQLWLNVTIPR